MAENESGWGLRLFKSADEAYKQDVVPRMRPEEEPVPYPFRSTQLAPTSQAGKPIAPAVQPATSYRPAAATQPEDGDEAVPYPFARQAPQPKPEPEQSNFSRGISVSGKQLKQTAYGTAALVGDTLGADSLKEWGLKGYKEAEKEVQAISKPSDSFTTAVETGEIGKWLTYSTGYLFGQVAELGAASLAGAAVGSLVAPGAGTVGGAVAGAVEKGAVQTGIRAAVGKMIDKQAAEYAAQYAAKGMAKEVAEKAAAEAAIKSVYRTIGATTANTFLNATQELGSIYGDAVEEAAKNGTEYSLGKVWLAGIAATAVDTWADSKAVGKFMDAFKGGKGVSGVAMEALRGGFREGMTEGIQTAIERWGADKDLTSKEAFKEYIDSAAVGILGGGIAGGASGAVNKFLRPTETKPGTTETGEDPLATKTSEKSAVNTEELPGLTPAEFQDTLRNMDALAYLHSVGSTADKSNIEKAVQRANLITEFNESVGRQDRIEAGKQMLAQEPQFTAMFLDELDNYANTQPTSTSVKTPRPKPLTEEDAMRRGGDGDQSNQGLRPNLNASSQQGGAAASAMPSAADVANAISSGVELGRGGNAVVFDLPGTDFVVRVPKGASAPSASDVVTPVSDPFSGRNFGQPLAKVGEVQILRRQNGIPAGLTNYRGLSQTDADARYLEALSRAASLPQSAYDQFARDLKFLNDVGAAFDPSKSNNVLIDSGAGRFNLVDINQDGKGSYKNSFGDMVVTLLGNTYAWKFKGDTALAQQLQRSIYEKSMGAAKKAGLEIDESDPSVAYSRKLAGLGDAASQAGASDQKGQTQTASDQAQTNPFDDLDSAPAQTAPKKEIRFSKVALGKGAQQPTTPKPTVSQLPAAMTKVMETIIGSGTTDFVEVSRQVMDRMRSSKNWSGLTNQVSPAMLRQAYNSARGEGKQSAQEVAAVTREQLAQAVAKPQEQKQETKTEVKANQRLDSDSDFEPLLDGKRGQVIPTYRQGAKLIKTKSGEAIIQTDQRPVNLRVVSGIEGESDKQSFGLTERRSGKKVEKAPAAKPVEQGRAEQDQALAERGETRQSFNERKREEQRQRSEQILSNAMDGSQGAFNFTGILRAQESSKQQALRLRLEEILRSSMRIKFFEDTILMLQQQISEIESRLKEMDRIQVGEGKQRLTFQARRDDDERPGLWGIYDLNAYSRFEDGLVMDKPSNKADLLEARRRLSDELTRVRENSIKSKALLYKKSMSRLADQFMQATQSAIRRGMSESEARAIFSEFYQAVTFRDVKAQEKPEAAVQEFNQDAQFDFFDGARVAMGIIADYRSTRSSDKDLEAALSRGLREGDFSYTDMMNAFRAFKISPPSGVYNVSNQLAMRTKLDSHLASSKSVGAAVREYMVSMDRVLSANPSLRGRFTEQELALYDDFVRNRRSLESRRRVTEQMRESQSAILAFENLLFSRFKLSEIRNPELSGQSTNVRDAITSVLGTPDMREEAWFQDVAYAMRRRPDLANQVRSIIDPADMVEFDRWVQRKKDAIAKESEILAKIPAFTELRNMAPPEAIKAGLDSLPMRDKTVVREDTSPGMYEQLYIQIANAELSELPAIMESAARLNSILLGKIDPDTGEILTESQADELAAEYIDSLVMNSQMVEPERDNYGMRYQESPSAKTLEEAGVRDLGKPVQEIGDESVDELQNEGRDVDLADTLQPGEETDETGGAEASQAEGEMAAEERDTPAERVKIPSSLTGGEFRFRKGFFNNVLTAAVVQDYVARITSKWLGAPKITVIPNVAHLPADIRQQVMDQLGSEMGAKGLYVDGEVFLFSDMLTSRSDVEFTLFHEVYGHLGFRAFFGEKFDAFLENMYRAYSGVRAAVDAKMDAEAIGKLEAIDEVLSDIAGQNENFGPVKLWVGKIIASLREIGFNGVADWLASLTNAELSFYLSSARSYAQNGGYRAINGAPGTIRMKEAQHERLYEMFSTNGKDTRGYARFNPVTQTWTVFASTGSDIRGGYTANVYGDYEQVLDLMRKMGKTEFRKRSGLFIDDKLPGDLPKLSEVTDVQGVKRRMRSLITKYQNEFKPVFDVVDYLASKGRINERTDLKTALLLYERKTGAIIDHFRRNYVQPIQRLVEEAGRQGADYETINMFLLARHAKERNEQIARVNPKMPDGGSGMKTQDALDYLASLQGKPFLQALQEIGVMTDRMSEQKLKYMVNTGMITKGYTTRSGMKISRAYEKMSQYKHYVNLSGQRDNLDEFEDPGLLIGTKFNVKGVERRAMGRSGVASDILANTILGMESALIRGQKNLVAQKVLALIEANYDPNFAVVNEIAYTRKIGEDGMVMDVEDTQYIQRKDVMVAKVNGVPVTIKFKDNTPGSFAEAIHGMVYPPQSNLWMERMGKFNQFMGQMLTTYNPVWVGVNFLRDTQTLYFNAASDGRITKAQAAAMVRTLPKAIATAYYMARVEAGLPTNYRPDPEMVRVYNEMKLAGGMTSFLDRKGLESQVGEIEKLLGNRTKLQSAGDKFKNFLDFVERLTIPMEVAPRLAAYKVTREAGFTKDQAAVFSGEITVNFNMRGASKEMRQLYLFFNPAVQGTAKLVDLARKNPGRMAAYAAAWAGVGMLANLVGRAFSGDDEDGINNLDKVPVYKRSTSMVLSSDIPFASIPIAYGWNAFYSMGHFMLDSALGIQPVSVSAGRAAKAAFEAFTPLGTAGLDSKTGAGMVVKGVAPTGVLPIVELMLNENRYGAPIYKEGDVFGGPVLPDSQMAFRSVSPISRSMMQGLNELTRGNAIRPGFIDVNPATVDYLISAYLPGIGAEGYKLASVAARISRGEELKNTPTPFVDRFTAKIPEGFDAGAFRRVKELAETRYAEYMRYPEKREELRNETPGLLQARAVIASATQQIRELRSNLAEKERNPRFTEAQLVEALNRTREREKQIYDRVVRRVMEAGPDFRNAVLAAD